MTIHHRQPDAAIGLARHADHRRRRQVGGQQADADPAPRERPPGQEVVFRILGCTRGLTGDVIGYRKQDQRIGAHDHKIEHG